MGPSYRLLRQWIRAKEQNGRIRTMLYLSILVRAGSIADDKIAASQTTGTVHLLASKVTGEGPVSHLG